MGTINTLVNLGKNLTRSAAQGYITQSMLSDNALFAEVKARAENDRLDAAFYVSGAIAGDTKDRIETEMAHFRWGYLEAKHTAQTGQKPCSLFDDRRSYDLGTLVYEVRRRVLGKK